MQRETVLAGVAVLLVLGGGVAAAAAPGVLAETDDPVREGHLDLREAPITPANVSGDTVQLTLTNWLSHRGGPVENVSLLTRVVDEDTGLVTTRSTEAVGTIDQPGDHAVTTNITVERSGDYRIETLVFVDGERVDRGTASVSGLTALEPDFARTGLRFHRFQGSSFPAIPFRVASADGEQVTLRATPYLTNGASEPAGDLRVVLRARQVDSNIVADRTSTSVSNVRPGRTARPDLSLSVPANYSYRLDALLLRDDVIVDTTSAVADLNPTRTVEEDTEQETVNIDAESFADDSDSRDDRPLTTPSGSGPGFGPLAALVGVVGATLLLARRHDD